MPTTSAFSSEPRGRRRDFSPGGGGGGAARWTHTSVASDTTCAFVTTNPAESTKNPEPVPETSDNRVDPCPES